MARLASTSRGKTAPERGSTVRSTAKGGAAVGARAKRSAERREAILAAALEEFSGHGFEAARLEDVAKRAGVAKGTIYLYFADKEALFLELIRWQLTPVVGAFEHAANIDIPMRMIADQMIELFVREIYDTRRKDVIRLIISEGPRFPKLAEFYYREVLSKLIDALRGILRRAVARGELNSDVYVKFPQLLVSPGLVAILWNGLFDRFEPLDPRALMRAHFDLILGDGRAA
jgi:AcrR family transcriptional regulator